MKTAPMNARCLLSNTPTAVWSRMMTAEGSGGRRWNETKNIQYTHTHTHRITSHLYLHKQSACICVSLRKAVYLYLFNHLILYKLGTNIILNHLLYIRVYVQEYICIKITNYLCKLCLLIRDLCIL